MFYISDGLNVYGSAGEIFISNLYDIYCANRNRLDPQYMISGTFRSMPYECTIKHIEEVYLNESYELFISGVGMAGCNFIVHPNQTFWTVDGNTICVKNITRPHVQIAALNGALDIASVGKLTTPHKFYCVEPGRIIRPVGRTIMKSLYVSNLILLPVNEDSKDLPFFVQ